MLCLRLKRAGRCALRLHRRARGRGRIRQPFRESASTEDHSLALWSAVGPAACDNRLRLAKPGREAARCAVPTGPLGGAQHKRSVSEPRNPSHRCGDQVPLPKTRSGEDAKEGSRSSCLQRKEWAGCPASAARSTLCRKNSVRRLRKVATNCSFQRENQEAAVARTPACRARPCEPLHTQADTTEA